MANSYVEYPTSGTGNQLNQKVFQIPFKYIAIADVEVKGYNGSTWTDLTIAATDSTAKTVELSAIPSSYTKIRVWRNTSTTQLVDFQNGSRLSESDLDTAYQQGLFVAQEVSENASTGALSKGDQGIQGIQGPAGADAIDSNGEVLLDTIKANTSDIVFNTNSTERARITSSGNVGIGTTSGLSGPSATTSLRVGNQINIYEYDDGSNPVQMNINQNIDANENYITTDQAARYQMRDGVHKWFTVGSGTAGTASGIGSGEKMQIASSGNLLLGTGYDALNARQVVRFEGTGSNMIGLTIWTGGGSGIRYASFVNSSGLQNGTITQNGGSAVSYNTSSDYRLKTDAQPMTGASARVQALNPVNFEWITDGTRVDGFLAHEAQAVVPEAITGTKDAVDADGNPEYQGIDQSKLVPLLTAALQEALTEIASLKTRVEALEA